MRRTFLKTFSAEILILLLIPSFVQADELPLFYEGVRPLGMGGAFTAVADDENAMLYNPAGLNQIKGFGQFEIFNPTFEFSQQVVEFAKDVQEITQISDPTKQFDQATGLITKWLGEQLHLKMGLFPNIVFHNFGIGILAQGDMNGEVHNPLSSKALEVNGTADAALLVSGAYRIDIKKGHPLLVGITAKGINRQNIAMDCSIRQLSEGKFSEEGCKVPKSVNEELGFALDIGALYPVPVSLKPTIGISFQNVVEGDFGTSTRPLPFQMNLGVSLKPKIRFGKILLATDIMDITRNVGNDQDIAKRLHMGLEYRFPRILAFRTGLYQGYPSFGATFDLWFAKLAYAYHTEEIGAFAGQKPDTRHTAQLSLGF